MQNPVQLRHALDDAKEDLMLFVENRGNDTVAANLHESLSILTTAIQNERMLAGIAAPVTAELQEAYLVLTVNRLVQQKPSDASSVFEHIKHTCTKTLRLFNSTNDGASTIMQLLWTGGAGKIPSLFDLTYTLSECAVQQPQKSRKRRRLPANESTRPVEAWKICYCYFICALALETLYGEGIPATRDDWNKQVDSLVERPLAFSTAMSTAKSLFLLDQCTEEKPRLPNDFDRNLDEPVKELIELDALSQATGLDRYIVAAAIMERLMKKDDPDRELSSLFCLPLQESGRYEFIENIKSSSNTENRKRRLDTENRKRRLDDGGSTSNVRTPHERFYQPGYPICVEIRVLLYLGRTSEAITLADDMAKLPLIAECDKRQAYSTIFDFLLSEGLILFSPPERRQERLEILFVPHAGKLAMETFLGCLDDFSMQVESKEGASIEVKTYLKKACHQAQIRLLRSKYVVANRIPEDLRYGFPSFGQVQLDQWLVDYPDQHNLCPVPISESDAELLDRVGLEVPPAEPDFVVDDDVAEEAPPSFAPNFSLGPIVASQPLPRDASEVLELDDDDHDGDSATKMHGIGSLDEDAVLDDTNGAPFQDDAIAEVAESESEVDDVDIQVGEGSGHGSSDESFQNADSGDESKSEVYGYTEQCADDESGEPSDAGSGQGGSSNVDDRSNSRSVSSVEEVSSDGDEDDGHGSDEDPFDGGFPAGSIDRIDDRCASTFRAIEHPVGQLEDDHGYDAEASQDNLSEEEDNPANHGASREIAFTVPSSLLEEEGYEAELSQNTATEEEDNAPQLDYATTLPSNSDSNAARQLSPMEQTSGASGFILEQDEDGYVPEGEISQEEDNKKSPVTHRALRGTDEVDIREEENMGYEGEISQDNATDDEDNQQSRSAQSTSWSNTGQTDSLIPPPPIRAVEKEGDPGYDADADGKPIRKAVKPSVEHEASQETGYSAGESEELSEAIQTEDEEDKFQASQEFETSFPDEPGKGTVPKLLSSRSEMQQRSLAYTYSDMSAADERTTGGHEEDPGAESSSDIDLLVDFRRSEIEPYYPQNGTGFQGGSLQDVARIVQGSSGTNTMHAPERRAASSAASILSRIVKETDGTTPVRDSSATALETVIESPRQETPSADTVGQLGRKAHNPEETAIVDHVPHGSGLIVQNEERVGDTTASLAGSQQDMSIATSTGSTEVVDNFRAEANIEENAIVDHVPQVDEDFLHLEDRVSDTTASVAGSQRDTSVETETAATESARADNNPEESAVVDHVPQDDDILHHDQEQAGDTTASITGSQRDASIATETAVNEVAVVDHVPQDGDESFPYSLEHMGDTNASIAGSARDTSIATETAASEVSKQADVDTAICTEMNAYTEDDINETALQGSVAEAPSVGDASALVQYPIAEKSENANLTVSKKLPEMKFNNNASTKGTDSPCDYIESSAAEDGSFSGVAPAESSQLGVASILANSEPEKSNDENCAQNVAEGDELVAQFPISSEIEDRDQRSVDDEVEYNREEEAVVKTKNGERTEETHNEPLEASAERQYDERLGNFDTKAVFENNGQAGPDSEFHREEMVESTDDNELLAMSQATKQSADVVGDEAISQKPAGRQTRSTAKAQKDNDSVVAGASTTTGESVSRQSTHQSNITVAGANRSSTRSRTRHADSDNEAGASVASSTRSGSRRSTPQKKNAAATDSSKDTPMSLTRTPRTRRKPADQSDAENSVASSVARRRRRTTRKPAGHDASDAEDSVAASSLASSSNSRQRRGATAIGEDAEPKSTPRSTPAKAAAETPPSRQSARLRQRQLAKLQQTEKDADEASVTSSNAGRRQRAGSTVRRSTNDDEGEELPATKKLKTATKPPLAPAPSRRSGRKK